MPFHEPQLNEWSRLRALDELSVLDTFPERCYDNLVELAAKICETPIAAISLVAENRTWSKSVLGLTDDQRNCPREFSFCAVAIKSDEPTFQIHDATKDQYFAGSPLVEEPPHISFYAAALLKTSSGHVVGTLCVLDNVPRKLTQFQLDTLRVLGDQAMLILETRAQLSKTKAEISRVIESSASQSESYLRATLNSIDAGFVGIDLNGLVTICNDASLNMLGFENAAEFVGQRLQTSLKLLDSHDSFFGESDHPILAAARLGNSFHSEAKLMRRDGTLVPIAYWVTPTVLHGELQGAVVSLVDITERLSRDFALSREREKLNTALEKSKRTELGLARERYLLDQIFKNSPAAMATWFGDDLVFDRVNARYQSIFPNRSLIGKRLLDVCPELRGQGFDDLLRDVMRSGQAWSGEEVLARISPEFGAPAEDRYFDVSYHPVFNEQGAVYAVYNHSVDVTEAVVAKRQLETARAHAESANVAKSQFLANMSHEIRTPLGAIIGFADVLSAEDGTPAERSRLFERIKKNGSQLTNLIDDLLDLTKVEANRISVELAQFDLLEFLIELKDLFSTTAAERSITLEFKIEKQMPRFIVSDAKRVRQILVNLIGNALKFTPLGGEVEVAISASVTGDETVLEFLVKDSGPGIPQEQSDKLFVPFAQGDVSITRKFGGSGLGLFVSRRLAKLLNGDVDIKSSEVGRGTTLRFVTRAGLATDRSVVAELRDTPDALKAPHQNVSELKNIRVLVVDDSPDNRELIRNYLHRAGAFVSFGENGRDGVDRAVEGNFDVVLMDIQMPVLDGNSAMIELKTKGYGKPVIALTAHAMVEEKTHSLKLGFQDYLTKPIAKEILIAAILKAAR